MPPDSNHPGLQLLWMFVLAIPIACVAWTVTHEEIFKEPREYCKKRSKRCADLLERKFFYLFTCEYCFSHYIAFVFLCLTHFKLLLDDWRGYVLSMFAEVWIANAYMGLLGRLRVDIRRERANADIKEAAIKDRQPQPALDGGPYPL